MIHRCVIIHGWGSKPSLQLQINQHKINTVSNKIQSICTMIIGHGDFV